MKTVFWNVDTQYDFMRENGKLPIPGAIEIEKNLEDLTLLAKEKNLQLINTGDWHEKTSKELSDKPDFVNTFPPHCMKNTIGAEFVPATAPENPYVIDWRAKDFDKEKLRNAKNVVLYKDAFDIFSGNKYADQVVVDVIKPDRAIVYGVATNVCVDFAVMGLLERNVEVYVPVDAIKELPNLPLPLDKWKEKGAKLIQTNDVKNYFGVRK